MRSCTGINADYDPKNAFSFRFGVQQSNPDATSLSDSIYSLAEIGYTFTPFSLPEGHYRLWYRANNGAVESKRAVGVSVDQKLTPVVTAFAIVKPEIPKSAVCASETMPP